jgi:cytochrome P450
MSYSMGVEGDFRHDPLGWIDRFVATGAPCAWIPGRSLCIADPEVGRGVLWNSAGLFQEHSDFFGRRFGLTPRAAQVEMGRGVRALLETRIASLDLPSIASAVPATTHWPAAGADLLFDMMRPALFAPDRSPRLQALVGRLVESRMHGLARPARFDLRRLRLRHAFYAAVRTERMRDASAPDAAPRDILAVLFATLGPETSHRQIAQAYASFLFAIVGSTGFTLGWSILLASTHGALAEDPRRVVTEALRLFPVAWFLGRRPSRAQVLLGQVVEPSDRVVVSPYAIHRNPAHWTEPRRFLPSRWKANPDRSAWMPFGAGPHACMAAALSSDLVADIFAELRLRAPVVQALGARRPPGAALSPPPFTLGFQI